MDEQLLKDRDGRILGRISTQGNGLHQLRDASGNIKGFYDPKSDTTLNKDGSLAFRGNMLTALL